MRHSVYHPSLVGLNDCWDVSILKVPSMINSSGQNIKSGHLQLPVLAIDTMEGLGQILCLFCSHGW